VQQLFLRAPQIFVSLARLFVNWLRSTARQPGCPPRSAGYMGAENSRGVRLPTTNPPTIVVLRPQGDNVRGFDLLFFPEIGNQAWKRQALRGKEWARTARIC